MLLSTDGGVVRVLLLLPPLALLLQRSLLVGAVGAAAALKPPSIRPGQVWRDSDGDAINAHGAGMLLHNGTYYWYGSRRTVNASGTQMDGGIALYTSRDLYTWDNKGLVLQPFNCTSNSSRSSSSVWGKAAPNLGAKSYPPPSCTHGNGLDLERPKVVQCGGSGGKFVMWVRGTGYGNSPQLLGVLEADSPMGPFHFVSNAVSDTSTQIWVFWLLLGFG
jgi:hypothetical protein